MQLLTADENAPRHDIARGVIALVVAVAPVVTDAVDDAGGEDRNPRHLHRPDRQPEGTEERQVDDEHQHDAFAGVRGVQMSLNPVVRRATAVLLHGLAVPGRIAIEFGACPQHAPDAELLRATGIVRGFDLGVVLAVNRGPFLGDHAGGEPEPEAEEWLTTGAGSSARCAW